jgi:transposase
MLVIKLRETIMILDLHQQGLTVSAISRETGIDRKTVRKYIERGLEAPAYGPRKPRATVIDPFASYLRERVKTYPGLTGSRLLRELRDRGYAGGYTAVTDFLRDVRPLSSQGFEVRFETPAEAPLHRPHQVRLLRWRLFDDLQTPSWLHKCTQQGHLRQLA